MNKFLQLTTIIISIILLSGCQLTQTQTYSSEQYSFEYPNSYQIEEPTESYLVLTIRGDEGRIEIFRASDFADPLTDLMGERLHGYSSSGLDEYESQFVPKQKSRVGDFDIWLFYQEGDTKTRESLKAIFQSITLIH